MSNDATPAAAPVPETLPYQVFAARLWQIIGGLRHVVAALGGRDHAAIPLVVLVWGRVGKLAIRFERLMARLAAGSLPPRRVRPEAGMMAGTTARTVAAAMAGTAAAAAGPRAGYVRMPRGFGWLVRRLQESAVFGSQLQALLDEPEMQALLAQCPRAASILRPLRAMLMLEEPGRPRRAKKPLRSFWDCVADMPIPAAAGAPGPPCRPPRCPTG